VAHYSYWLDGISDEGDFLSGIHTEGLNSAELIELLGLKLSEKDLLRLLVPEAPSGLWDIPHNFMSLLGIPSESYAWKSSHYCELEEKEGSTLFSRVE
jgi:hypothetical protein